MCPSFVDFCLKKSVIWYSVLLFYNLSLKNKNSSVCIPLLPHGDFGGMPEIILEPCKKYEQHRKNKVRVHSGRKALKSSLLTRLMERNHGSQNNTECFNVSM